MGVSRACGEVAVLLFELSDCQHGINFPAMGLWKKQLLFCLSKTCQNRACEWIEHRALKWLLLHMGTHGLTLCSTGCILVLHPGWELLYSLKAGVMMLVQ